MKEINLNSCKSIEDALDTLKKESSDAKEICYGYVDGERIYSSDSIAVAHVKVEWEKNKLQ